METLTRKQRERLEREARILEVAQPVVIRQGYHALNMDRIAEALEYSKGTIYSHFSCKEEIIIALAIQTTERRTEMFQRAAAFRGTSRERVSAIGIAAELFVRLYPDHFKLEQIIRSDSIWEKTTEERRNVMRACESRCISIVGGVVRDAIAQGDLELPALTTPEEVVFGLWSMSLGAFFIIVASDGLVQLGITDPYAAYRMNISKMVDGFNWRPLDSEYDYDQSLRRIEKEVFSDEFRSIGN